MKVHTRWLLMVASMEELSALGYDERKVHMKALMVALLMEYMLVPDWV